MKQSILVQNPHWDWKNIIPVSYKKRVKYFDELKKQTDNTKISILTGMRRIGKTTLMRQIIDYLIQEKKVNSKHILYYSCDTIGGSTYNTLIDMIEDVRKYNEIWDNTMYCFIDEVTYMHDFHIQLKNIFDISWLHNNNIKLFVTSSSSSIIHDNKAMLTGRHHTIEVWPLDYNEYCEFTDKEVHKDGRYFEEYLQYGGIPEYIISKDPEVLKNIINDIIMKDIIMQYDVRDKKSLFDLFLLLTERVWKEVSITKLSNVLDISKQTVQKWIEYFEITYLFKFVGKFWKINETIKNAKKVYCIDNAIVSLYRGISNIGALYENTIYGLLKNQQPYYYYKDGNEIDFIIWERNNYTLIECKYRQECNPGQKKLIDWFDGKTIIAEWYEWYLHIKNIL